ncbi:MAG: tRNA 2-thiocytidine(32) synthetase TtcA [Lachnospiraceae bacterium]|nr:tRNA 2-thiocytidine(32) synthetase TtcA [Lachnospiraceae bacterium]
MKLQKLYSYARRAIDDYNMIEEGDRIAVGISGGKDSLTLLYALHGLMQFYPKHFEIIAITVDVGFKGMNFEGVSALCDKLGVDYHIVHTDIAQIVFDERKESSPCSLCAKMRKGALNETIKELGCNKVAYAHHRDDVVETMLLSLMYEGRFHTFAPVTYLDRMCVTVIRPLIYVHEADVIGFMRRYDIPVVKSTCPADGNTRREYAHNLLKQMMVEDPAIKNRMFTAICDSNIKGWERQEGAHY